MSFSFMTTRDGKPARMDAVKSGASSFLISSSVITSMAFPPAWVRRSVCDLMIEKRSYDAFQVKRFDECPNSGGASSRPLECCRFGPRREAWTCDDPQGRGGRRCNLVDQRKRGRDQA